MLPPALYEKLVARNEARRSGSKEAVTMLLDPDGVERLRAGGPDWEERAAEMLREAVGL